MPDFLPVTIFLGFLLGLRHATDPDHVVAVATIVSRERSARAAGAIGALWGLGHSLTILLAGGALVLLKVSVAPRVGLALEFGVAVMLVLLGALNLRRTHGHAHDAPSGGHAARPVIVGVVHGLAGTGAVAVAIVPLIPSAAWALVYLALFGLGTVAGMTLVTAAIAVPTALAARRVRGGPGGDGAHGMHGWLRVASGVASIAFGLFLAHRIGVVEGLFLGAAR